MKDLISLMDAICDTYDRKDLIPTPSGITWCNVAVAAVANAMGCKELDFKTADEIVAYIRDNPDWSDVPMERCQDMANVGSLVVAGLDSQALGQAHGHVVIIRPGKPCYSGKWGLTPRALNVGRENFLARAKTGPLTGMACGLNEAFVNVPKIWVWRPSL